MLPFFFRHYDNFVSRYIIFDDNSTDESLSILNSHSNVDVRRFKWRSLDSFVLSEQSLSNQIWKESRGKADWVIVTDIDEHLFHPSMLDYLQSSTRCGVTLIPAMGFQMLIEDTPNSDETLCERYTVGAPWMQMMKCSIFSPNIQE